MTTVAAMVPAEHTSAVSPGRRWLPAALTAAVVLPIVVSVARAVRQHWFPVGDSALLAVRARDVLTADHPWLGSWTSASTSIGHDVNNPGPLYSDLIAPFARLLHGGAGIAVGVGTVNVIAVVGASLAARHVGGWRLQRVVLVAIAVLVWSMGSWLLVDIWQPHALLLPFVLLLVLLIGVASQRWRCVPWVAAVGSLIVQTHIAYAFVLAALGAVVLAILAVKRRSVTGFPWRRTLTGRRARWTYGLLLVLWSQPLVEQLFGTGEGNLTRLATGASGGGLKIGGRDATRLTAAVLLQPPWRWRSGFSTVVPRVLLTQGAAGPTLVITGIHRFAIAAPLLALAVAALVLLARAHGRRGDALLATACWFAGASIVGAVACVAMISIGPAGFGRHLVRWLWPLGIVVQAIGAWAAVALLARRPARSARVRRALPRVATLASAAAVALLVLAALPALAQPDGPTADRVAMPALRQVFRQLDVLRDSSPVVFDTGNLVVFEPYSTAVMLRLQELGIAFHVEDPSMVRQLGERRRATGTERTTIFQLEHLDAVEYAGSACRIAAGSSLAQADAAVAARQAGELADRLAQGAVDVDEARLGTDDAARVRAARDGDGAAARRIVDDGTLARWARDGAAVIDDDDRAALDLIDRWVASAYALYAIDPVTCPLDH